MHRPAVGRWGCLIGHWAAAAMGALVPYAGLLLMVSLRPTVFSGGDSGDTLIYKAFFVPGGTLQAGTGGDKSAPFQCERP